MHATTAPAAGLRSPGLALLGSELPGVSLPTYDPRALAPGVVHLGVGNFHRAHQAAYLDELAERRIASEWAVIGVGLRRPTMKRALRPQDCLYTLVQRGRFEDEARVIGAIRRYLLAPEDPQAVLAALSDPATRIVTLTVTGDGYNVDRVTRAFEADAPGIRADLRDPTSPRTVPGYLVEALARRRRAGTAPFTVLSCDNLQRNGAVARTCVLSLAALRDEKLARWIESHVAFPSSMVDRITPKTTSATRALVADRFGLDDRSPVVCEPYRQWVIEDSFSSDRPPLEEAGAHFVADVSAHELIKSRLLNGSHSALGYLGYLAGHRRTDEAMADPTLRAYLAALMDEELTPLLPDAVGIELGSYKATLLKRFANPNVPDQLSRLCARGSTKMPAYLLPSAADAVAQGGRHELLALAVAGWFRYLRGVDFDGNAIEIEDPLGERLQALALSGGDDPRPLLAERSVFGDLRDSARFVASLASALRSLDRDGPAATIDAYTRAALSVAA